MAKIKTIVEALSLDALNPTPPEAAPPVPTAEQDLDEAVLNELIEKVTKPWQYGNCLSRFAKEAGVSIQIVREVKKQIDKRKALEEMKKPKPTEEPVEE